MIYNKKIFITINLMLLLSILLPIHAGYVLIVTKVAYGLDENNNKNVTDKFFNRKNNSNWMKETLGNPFNVTKQLYIYYKKLNAVQWSNFSRLLKTQPKTLIIPERRGLNLEQQPYSAVGKIQDSNTIYIIEAAAYEAAAYGLISNVTDKFANRPNDTDWMNETFGDPYQGTTKKLYIKYLLIDENDYSQALNEYKSIGYNSPSTIIKKLEEKQGIEGL